ncbi:hypothetical protein CAPTEDRAFT_206858 [Capitella teleta]|uniref:CCHC-type domain-containing protein n=1 Tax=Capitella teleta TaxID=283909 RepID=R7TKC4_CAPTE|nr:hypothetical protein CAPTEDRAFT_206858 [Capitella teleta]|eukprot:ELT94258.1 hypothetical protein CAPTEDRAFT_206858 [Capitella teleta]
MNIDEDPKDKTLRNLLMNGLTSREIYRECLKEKADQLSSKRVMEIASNIEARNLMDEDLSDMANQLLPSNALSRGSPSCVNKIHHENSNDFSNSQLSISLSCGWCGGRKRCRRQECPAKDSKCNKCKKMGHWGKVCRMKNRAGNVKARVHRIMDSNDHDQSDEDDATSVDFDSLNTFPDPKDPHLRPLWFSDPQKSDIHLIEAEVDSGAGCNTFPLYVYKKIFGAAPMDRPSCDHKSLWRPTGEKSCKPQWTTTIDMQKRGMSCKSCRVWFKKEPAANWKPATVIERPSDSPRAYIVQDDAGTCFQRTSKHV